MTPIEFVKYFTDNVKPINQAGRRENLAVYVKPTKDLLEVLINRK